MRYKTIWRNFESCNNYAMPKPVPAYNGRLQYWYGEKEEKDRAWDIRYVKANFPGVKWVKLPDMGHASMASLHAQDMAQRLEALANSSSIQ